MKVSPLPCQTVHQLLSQIFWARTLPTTQRWMKMRADTCPTASWTPIGAQWHSTWTTRRTLPRTPRSSPCPHFPVARLKAGTATLPAQKTLQEIPFLTTQTFTESGIQFSQHSTEVTSLILPSHHHQVRVRVIFQVRVRAHHHRVLLPY